MRCAATLARCEGTEMESGTVSGTVAAGEMCMVRDFTKTEGLSDEFVILFAKAVVEAGKVYDLDDVVILANPDHPHMGERDKVYGVDLAYDSMVPLGEVWWELWSNYTRIRQIREDMGR